MESIKKEFRGYPSQEKVVAELMRSGIRVIDGIAYCNDIKISDSALGRASGVDRRVVRTTLEKIDSVPRLKRIFSNLISISLLSDVAGDMGCTTIEITPQDSRIPGILSDVTQVVYRAGISVKQAVVVEPGYDGEPRLVMVLDGVFPSEQLPVLRSCHGVKSVILK